VCFNRAFKAARAVDPTVKYVDYLEARSRASNWTYAYWNSTPRNRGSNSDRVICSGLGERLRASLGEPDERAGPVQLQPAALDRKLEAG
jgi:hypothetical protein